VVARSAPRNTRLLVLGLVAASLAIITVDYREGDAGPLASLGRGAQAFMAPLQEGVTTATRPVADFFTGIAHLPTLARDNQDLRDQIADLQTRVAVDSQLQAQIQQLEEELGLKNALFPHAVPAVVIANGLSNFDYSITIDKGSNDGIAIDQPVIAGSAESPRLVGLVVSVTPISADVRLLIDRDFSVAGRLASSGVTGLVVGQGDQDLQMQNITAETKFPSGNAPEYVFTVSYHIGEQRGRYPPELLIGQVSKVYQGVTPLDEVSISPAVDFTALEYVLVLQTLPGTNG
jgi:rod shape-determining protein MreC